MHFAQSLFIAFLYSFKDKAICCKHFEISMKILKYLSVLLYLSSIFRFFSLNAESPVTEEQLFDFYRDEVDALDKLITNQQKRLENQKELKDLMILFRFQKESFRKGEQTQKLASSMVNNAKAILALVQQERIAHLFTSEYLEELVFFSTVVGKSKPQRP